ncbi:MAG: tetratricopeptide repeat protein [Patescibacteria group bacterium]|nr:tetratricopeptide repeat protein [Patescibacteria group bacterium]
MFNRIIKLFVYSLVFLMPLFFLPFTAEAFEFNKQYILFFLTIIALFAWLANMAWKNKEARFCRAPLDLPILGFLFIASLSAVFSVDKGFSLFGFYGRFSDGLITLLSFGAFYFLITNLTKRNNNKDKEENKEKNSDNNDKNDNYPLTINGLIKSFLASLFFVILAGYFSIFGIWQKIDASLRLWNSDFHLPSMMLAKTFNTVSGSMQGLAIFLAFSVVFLTGFILSRSNSNAEIKKKEKLYKIYLLLFSAFILLLIIDFTPAWIALTVSLGLFTGFALYKRMFKQDVNRLLIPIFLIIIGAISIFVNYQTMFANSNISFASDLLTLQQKQTLPQKTSFQIAFGTVSDSVKSALIGTGTGSFYHDFSKFKPAEFNQTEFSGIRFDRPGNHIAEIIATMGILGILSYSCVIGFFLFISYLVIIHISKVLFENKTENSKYQIPLLLGFIVLLIAQFIYYQNLVLGFMFWFCLALSTVVWDKPIKQKNLSFKDYPEFSLLFNIILTVFLIAIFVFIFFGARFYIADASYLKALNPNSEISIEHRIGYLEKAMIMNPWQSQYKVALARTYLSLALGQITLSDKDKQISEQDIVKYIRLSVSYMNGGKVFYPGYSDDVVNQKEISVKGATQLSPNWEITWETIGAIYRDIQGIAPDSLEWGIKSFEKAVALEPNNPFLYVELGKLYMNNEQNDKALEKFDRAIELNPNFAQVFIQKALVFEKQENITEAIKIMENASNDNLSNTEILFQLGRLYFNNNQIEESVLEFKKVLEITPNHSNARYALATAYVKQGKKTLAVMEFEKVLELNPDNEDVKEKIKELSDKTSEVVEE